MRARTLRLADNATWRIVAAHLEEAGLVDRLGDIMQLPGDVIDGEREDVPAGPAQQLWLSQDGEPEGWRTWLPAGLEAIRRAEPVHCALPDRGADTQAAACDLMVLSMLFAAGAQLRGGALVHGALAACPGSGGERGVLMCAPGGTGKSTASRRLPVPWRSLCDDATLVVRDSRGRWCGHPWPTWSRFLWGGPGGSWPVALTVPLDSIFFLEQAPADEAVPLNAAQAALGLARFIEQASHLMVRRVEPALARPLRVEWLDVAARLARSLPVYRLRLGLTGAFWEEMERVIA